MQPISNPRGRFESAYLEWDEAPPPAELQVYEDATRGVLAENDSPDIGFRWSLNPYRGCTHACAYCYARPSHEYLGFGAGSDFDSRIVVKLRSAELLREALERPAWQGERICLSGNTDCYQPLEAHYRLTRGCLEVAAEVGNPVQIVTKGCLITRDIDLLAALARERLVAVAMSIAWSDDELQRRIEPGAPRPSRRFEALRKLSQAGVPCTVLVAPIVPGLNDDQVPAILEQARDAGALAAHRVALRLPFAVKEVFLARLAEAVPLRAARVEARIREMRGGALNDPRFGERMNGSGAYWDAIDRSFELLRRRLGLTREPDVLERVAPEKLRRRGQLSLFGA